MICPVNRALDWILCCIRNLLVHNVESNLQSTFNKMIHENKEKGINQNDGPSVQIFSFKKGIFLKNFTFHKKNWLIMKCTFK